MGETREFRKTDWLCFSGAECWENDQPLIRELPRCMVVASKGGLEIVVDSDTEESDCTSWFLVGVNLPNQAFARLVLDALPENVAGRVKEFGFTAL